jgi:hypothetical protein
MYRPPTARCWNIPASANCPVQLCIISDERGLISLDNTAQGWHPINNPELLRWTMFKIWLNKMELD